MPNVKLIAAALAATLVGGVVPGAVAEPAASVALPKPDMVGGKPLMQALKERHSTREFSPTPLPLEVLANLLWAANGVNRPPADKRTAPSAKGWHEIDVYVATADGLYLYDAKLHVLKLVVAQDLRALTGRQDFVKDAPVNLVYVADLARMDADASAEDKQLYAAADTGFIAQNVYLYCASQGLATVVRGWVDKDALAKAMQLKASQRVVLAQTVGYPRRP
jgi:SagB-type dehydrogenase family enzyme